MPLQETVYELAMRAARPAAQLLARTNPKIARGVAARRDARAALVEWAARHREDARPLYWLHAPSVGEGLMAQAILAAVRHEEPDAQIAFTYFSPSAERILASLGADVTGVLPWDTRGEVDAVVDALHPDAIAFVRTEIWPGVIRAARERWIPTLLLNAVLPESSSRLRTPARQLLRPYYEQLAAVGAITADHAERYARLGVPAVRALVTGDARFDQVWARVHAPDPNQALTDSLRDPGTFTLLAGSTWPSDEMVLVDALRALPAEPAWRALLVPHEPSAPHLHSLRSLCRAAGLTVATLTEVESGDAALPQVVLVDRLGVLADLYRVAHVAYVGGGFHDAGLHSVVEPAALAVPVLFGPQHENAREAGELAAAGGGRVVQDADELRHALNAWRSDDAARMRDGRAAEHFVRERLGAAHANADLLRRVARRA